MARRTTTARSYRAIGQSISLRRVEHSTNACQYHCQFKRDMRRTRFCGELVHDGRYGQVACSSQHTAIFRVGARICGGSCVGLRWLLLVIRRDDTRPCRSCRRDRRRAPRCHGRRTLCSSSSSTVIVPPRPLPPRPPTFDPFPLCSQNRLTDPARALDRALAHERTRYLGRVHEPLEHIYRHKLVVLAHLLGDTRAPVLYLHKEPLAVIVPRVAHVERETGVPVWRARATADMSCGKLAGNLLDHVFDGVVCEVACGGEGPRRPGGGMEMGGRMGWGDGCGDTIPKQNPRATKTRSASKNTKSVHQYQGGGWVGLIVLVLNTSFSMNMVLAGWKV